MTETLIILLAILLITLVSMFLVNKFKVKIFGLDLSFSKSTNNVNIVHQIVHLALDHNKELNDNQTKILHNQMTYAEGILSRIEAKLESEVSNDKIILVQLLVKDILKDSFKENGFSSYGPTDFANYIQNKISILRKLYNDNIGVTKFIESHDFSMLINDLYAHSSNCCNYWTNKSKDAINTYQKQYDELIKQIK